MLIGRDILTYNLHEKISFSGYDVAFCYLRDAFDFDKEFIQCIFPLPCKRNQDEGLNIKTKRQGVYCSMVAGYNTG
ncbi:MAG: hypothetical protein UZ08_BCD001001883 [Candidatus Parvibacillus calidus]|nr:MAG: hypothetical protein UZ08_BCD001001883 [Candidatus Parvibacillus calidus]